MVPETHPGVNSVSIGTNKNMNDPSLRSEILGVLMEKIIDWLSDFLKISQRWDLYKKNYKTLDAKLVLRYNLQLQLPWTIS